MSWDPNCVVSYPFLGSRTTHITKWRSRCETKDEWPHMTLKGLTSLPPSRSGGTNRHFASSSRRLIWCLRAIVLSLLPFDLRCFPRHLLLRLVGLPVLEFPSRSVTSAFRILCSRDCMISKPGYAGEAKGCPIGFCDGARGGSIYQSNIADDN